MKTMNLNHTIFAAAITIGAGFTAQAQKLPTVQQAGLYAPANIKVDGKATEWDNKFQAYNKSTAVFYTMANDADNLYLVMQATDRLIIDKILTNKLTFTILNAQDKNIVPISIITPSFPGNNSYFSNLMKNPSDSLVNVTNKALAANLKELKTTGISVITDPIISVYNDYGIKFAVRADNEKACNFELQLPIKYMSHLIAANSFSYKIQVNGLDLNRPARVVVNKGSDGGSIVNADGGGAAALAGPGIVITQMGSAGGPMSELMSDTNFTGTYTLVKK